MDQSAAPQPNNSVDAAVVAGEDKTTTTANNNLGHFNGFNVSRVKKVKLEGTGESEYRVGFQDGGGGCWPVD